MERKNAQRNDQDLELIIEVPLINDEPFDLANNDFDVNIYGTKSSVSIQGRRGEMTSVGEISANSDIDGNRLIVYAKSSKVPFGVGCLSVEMVFYAPHQKFEDDIQVMKTLKNIIDIPLV